MKKTLIFLVAPLILLGALLACGEASNNTGTLASGLTATATQAQATPTPAQHFKVGDRVKVGNIWEVTIEQVNTSAGADFLTPDAGKIYLLITVTTKNISNQEQTMSSMLSFKLRDTDGTEYNTAYYPDSNAPDGKAEANSQLKGVIAYEVPTTKKHFVFSFESDAFSAGQTLWDISI